MTGPLVVDVQAHLFPAEYLRALEAIARGTDRTASIARRALSSPITMRDPVFTTDLTQRLDLMDQAGVDVQILEFAAPNVWSEDVDRRRRATESFNDGCARIVREGAGRFAFVATLPVPHIDAAIAECDRALDQLDAVGVSLCTTIDGLDLDDRRFDPLYEHLARRRCAVLLHPEGFSVPGALTDHGMEWALGTPFDDTIAAVRLIYGGVLDRFPEIRWVVPHLGGVLPFLAKRLDFIWQLNAELREQLAAAPSDYLRRLWFDSANPDPRALQLAGDVLGVDRLMYASDFPFAQRRSLKPGIAAIDALSTDEDRRLDVRGRSAQNLFGLGTAASPR